MDSIFFTKKWYVFYTYPKFERKVQKYLQKEGYETFLPLHWIVKNWSDRKKRLQIPLFPNYIFVNIERNKIFDILKTPKVINCVTFCKDPVFIKQKEIDQINYIISKKSTIEVSDDLKIGTTVLINEGPLCGLEGVLLEERGSQRFAVKIVSLKQSLIINVPSNYIESVEMCYS